MTRAPLTAKLDCGFDCCLRITHYTSRTHREFLLTLPVCRIKYSACKVQDAEIWKCPSRGRSLRTSPPASSRPAPASPKRRTPRAAACRAHPSARALRVLQKLGSVAIRSNLAPARAIVPADARRLLRSPAFNGYGSRGIEPAFVDVAQRIKDLLVRDNGRGDAIIKDSVIARRLGVSRTTANRALGLLARQNLLEPLPRRGWKRVMMGPREAGGPLRLPPRRRTRGARIRLWPA